VLYSIGTEQRVHKVVVCTASVCSECNDISYNLNLQYTMMHALLYVVGLLHCVVLACRCHGVHSNSHELGEQKDKGKCTKDSTLLTCQRSQLVSFYSVLYALTSTVSAEME
jgi:hypothetical protein